MRPTPQQAQAQACDAIEKNLTFLPVAFSNIERSLSVIFSFCFLYFAESTGWPDCFASARHVSGLLSGTYVASKHARRNSICAGEVLQCYLLASELLGLVEGLVEVIFTAAVGHFCAGVCSLRVGLVWWW